MATESVPVSAKGIVGRGVAEGARLFRDWFTGLTETADRGGKAAYCFVAGNMVEILRVFDIPVTFPEINALQTAFRLLTRSQLNTTQAIERIRAEVPPCAEVDELIEFIHASGRGVVK